MRQHAAQQMGSEVGTIVGLHLAVVPALDQIGQLLGHGRDESRAPVRHGHTPPGRDMDELVFSAGAFPMLALTSVPVTLESPIGTMVEGLLAEYLGHYVRIEQCCRWG